MSGICLYYIARVFALTFHLDIPDKYQNFSVTVLYEDPIPERLIPGGAANIVNAKNSQRICGLAA